MYQKVQLKKSLSMFLHKSLSISKDQKKNKNNFIIIVIQYYEKVDLKKKL